METHAHSLYFEVAAVVTTFPLLGRHLGAKANQRTGDTLKALLNLGAKEATALRDGVESLIAADRLQPGDGFLVRPGEQIATDGFVTDSHTAVDTCSSRGSRCRWKSVLGA